jgi:hypothetical protein
MIEEMVDNQETWTMLIKARLIDDVDRHTQPLSHSALLSLAAACVRFTR